MRSSRRNSTISGVGPRESLCGSTICGGGLRETRSDYPSWSDWPRERGAKAISFSADTLMGSQRLRVELDLF
jgi:hypothetical protein